MEITMSQFASFQAVSLPNARSSRLTHANLRRPTALPSRVARGFATSYLQRVLWLFTGA
jgi:hypothetical protein